MLGAVAGPKRAWLIAAVLATPIGVYMAIQAATSPNSSLGYLFASVPLLLFGRAAARPPSSWILSGVIVAISVAGMSGIGILLIPFAATTLLLEVRDQASRPTFVRVGTITAAFMVTLTATIIAASALYRGR